MNVDDTALAAPALASTAPAVPAATAVVIAVFLSVDIKYTFCLLEKINTSDLDTYPTFSMPTLKVCVVLGFLLEILKARDSLSHPTHV